MPKGRLIPDDPVRRARLFHEELEQLVRDKYLTDGKKLVAIEKLVDNYFVPRCHTVPGAKGTSGEEGEK